MGLNSVIQLTKCFFLNQIGGFCVKRKIVTLHMYYQLVVLGAHTFDKELSVFVNADNV